MKLRKPATPPSSLLTVLGFLLISTAAAVLGLIVSVLLGAGLGLAVLGLSCLVLGWLAEPEAVETP